MQHLALGIVLALAVSIASEEWSTSAVDFDMSHCAEAPPQKAQTLNPPKAPTQAPKLTPQPAPKGKEQPAPKGKEQPAPQPKGLVEPVICEDKSVKCTKKWVKSKCAKKDKWWLNACPKSCGVCMHSDEVDLGSTAGVKKANVLTQGLANIKLKLNTFKVTPSSELTSTHHRGRQEVSEPVKISVSALKHYGKDEGVELTLTSKNNFDFRKGHLNIQVSTIGAVTPRALSVQLFSARPGNGRAELCRLGSADAAQFEVEYQDGDGAWHQTQPKLTFWCKEPNKCAQQIQPGTMKDIHGVRLKTWCEDTSGKRKGTRKSVELGVRLELFTEMSSFGWDDAVVSSLTKTIDTALQPKKTNPDVCKEVMRDCTVMAKFKEWRRSGDGIFQQDPKPGDAPIQLGLPNWNATASKKLFISSEGAVEKRMLCLEGPIFERTCCVNKGLGARDGISNKEWANLIARMENF
jgi:hypothetical protein